MAFAAVSSLTRTPAPPKPSPSWQRQPQWKVAAAVGVGGRSARATALPLTRAPLAVLAAAELGRRAATRRAAEAAEAAEAAKVEAVGGEEPAAAAPKTESEVIAEVRAAARERAKARSQKPKVFDPTKQLGVTEPLGFWDPLGLCPTDKNKYRKYRMSELKHGRVAMLAAVGFLVQHYIRIPLGTFDEVPSGVGAVLTAWGGFGCCLIAWICLVLEFVWSQDPLKEVGDFGDPLNVGMADDTMRNRELNNGRFAMVCVLGIVSAELFSGKDAVEQLMLR